MMSPNDLSLRDQTLELQVNLDYGCSIIIKSLTIRKSHINLSLELITEMWLLLSIGLLASLYVSPIHSTFKDSKVVNILKTIRSFIKLSSDFTCTRSPNIRVSDKLHLQIGMLPFMSGEVIPI